MISQQTYTEELGENFDTNWGGSIPLPTTCKLYNFDVDEPTIGCVFRELIGSLLWIAFLSRSDIENAVARYCSAPKMIHWKAVLGILGYAVRTSRFGNTFQRGAVEGFHLFSFADADYASKVTDRRSVSGGVVMCAGRPGSWYSKTQECVTLSTTQAKAGLAFHVAEDRDAMHHFV